MTPADQAYEVPLAVQLDRRRRRDRLRRREARRARIRIAAAVTLLAVAGVLWPPILWAVAALAVYCAVIALAWYAANRLGKRAGRRH